MNFILLGPAGSGKSTQAKMLADFLGVPCLTVGNLLSYISKADTKEAKEIKEAMEEGTLVEDELTLKILNEQLKSSSYENGVVIDGFPRNVEQAREFNFELEKVLYINISNEESKKRLFKRGRKDDTEEAIKERLDIFHEETRQVLDFYKEKGILIEVGGEREIEKIHQDILEKLNLSS